MDYPNAPTKEDIEWANQVFESMRYFPTAPFRAQPYDAARGITWTIIDANNMHKDHATNEEFTRYAVSNLRSNAISGCRGFLWGGFCALILG